MRITRWLGVPLAVGFVAGLLTWGAAAAGVTTLRVTTWGGTAELNTYNEIVRKFEAKNPDIKVKVEVLPWPEYWSRLTVQLAGGIAPDVARMSGAFFGRLVRDGVLLNLEPLIARDKLDIDGDFLPQGGIFQYQGDYYGLHDGGDIVALYYNKDMFDSTGVTAPTESWTWNDYLAAAKKLTRDTNGDGRPDRWGAEMIMQDMQSYWYNFLLQNGTTALNKEKTSSLLDTPAAIEAFEFMNSFYKLGYSPIPGSTGAQDDFMEEKVAMANRLTPLNITALANVKFDWDMAPLPKGKRRGSEMNWVAWTISRTTRNREAAWKLVRFLAEEGSWVLADTRQGLPSLKQAAMSDRFLAPLSKGPKNLRSTLLATLPYTADLQFTATWNDWTGVVWKEMSAVINGKKTVENALRSASEQVDRLLASEKR